MNRSTIFGIAAAVAVIWFGVIAHSAKASIFLDSHAMILVLGGTVAAGFIAFPAKKFKELGSFLVLGVLYPEKRVHVKVIEEILRLSVLNVRPGRFDLHELRFHPFLVEGYELTSRRRLSAQETKRVLMQRSQRFKERYSSDAKTLNALAKFPPAFGLLGATTGMISMMTGLGAGGQESIGPAMAIALVATFWGIAIANLILLPLADHASKIASNDASVREMIIVAVLMIRENERPAVIFEHLLGYLPISERNSTELLKSVKANDQHYIRFTTAEETVVDADPAFRRTGSES